MAIWVEEPPEKMAVIFPIQQSSLSTCAFVPHIISSKDCSKQAFLKGAWKVLKKWIFCTLCQLCCTPGMLSFLFVCIILSRNFGNKIRISFCKVSSQLKASVTMALIPQNTNIFPLWLSLVALSICMINPEILSSIVVSDCSRPKRYALRLPRSVCTHPG